jgi:hypothetical protein
VNIAISSALSGLRANLARMDASALRVAGRTADPVTEMVEQLDAKVNFQANIASLETARDMERGVIRLWA